MRWFTLILLALAPSVASAQCRSCSGGSCSGGACSPYAPIYVPPSEPEWVLRLTDEPDQLGVFQHGVQVGGYRISTGEYHRRYGVGSWGSAETPPFPVPAQYARARTRKECELRADCMCGCRDGNGCTCAVVAKDWQTNGVDGSKLSPARYSLTGKPCSRQDALDAVGTGTIPNDAALLRLTVIGSESDRAKVLADLAANGVAAKYVVNSYAPTDWHVASYGFVTAGTPSIYVQTPDGKVLHRQADYAGGYASLVEALRKADPTYPPDKDPDLRKPVVPPAPVVPLTPDAPANDTDYFPATAALAGLGLAAFVFVKKGS